jgi:Cof subfamily protein (haloacid dehalogenase superfamily)
MKKGRASPTGSAIRLIALDLDGTLLDTDGRTLEPNREALRTAAERGVVITLASGRMTDCITPFAEELGLDCYIMAYNGGMVRGSRAEGRRMLFHRPLEARYGRALIDYCRDRYMLNFYHDDRLYAQGNPGLRRFADIYARQTGAVYNFVEDLGKLADREPTKLILITDPPERDRLHDEWVSSLGAETTIVKTNPEYLEFLNRDTDKGVALMALGKALGLSAGEIMALGDGDNDAPMLREAGLGVAMANASALSKRSARVVSDFTNDQCAVADAVERHVLG